MSKLTKSIHGTTVDNMLDYAFLQSERWLATKKPVFPFNYLCISPHRYHHLAQWQPPQEEYDGPTQHGPEVDDDARRIIHTKHCIFNAQKFYPEMQPLNNDRFKTYWNAGRSVLHHSFHKPFFSLVISGTQVSLFHSDFFRVMSILKCGGLFSLIPKCVLHTAARLNLQQQNDTSLVAIGPWIPNSW